MRPRAEDDRLAGHRQDSSAAPSLVILWEAAERSIVCIIWWLFVYHFNTKYPRNHIGGIAGDRQGAHATQADTSVLDRESAFSLRLSAFA